MSEIEQIKEKVDIVEFISQFVTLKKTGRNFSAPCPFHHEKTPSFVVSPERQIWHCFGSCSEGGDIFKFLMKWENVDFPEALKDLAKRAHIPLSSWQGEDESFRKKQRLLEINHLASEYYHYILTTHRLGQKGRDYIEKRGISQKLMETFMMGYAPAAWDNLTLFLHKKGYKDQEIEEVGLAIHGRNGYYDRFRERVIFTLSDHRGNIMGFSGRTLSPDPKDAKYINSPETPLYHKSKMLFGLNITKDAIKKEGKVILCEGEFDVLSSYQAGITNIVAVKGTAITIDQLQLLKRFASELVLALDMDVAGDHAARRGIELAESLDFAIKVVKLPFGKDLDEAVRHDVLLVKKAVKHALSIYDFLIESAISRHGIEDAYAKKRVASDVIPLFAKIGNEIIRNHYTKKLSATLDINEDAIIQEINKEMRRPSTSPRAFMASTNQPPTPISREERLEDHLLTLIVQSDNPKAHLQLVEQNLTIEELDHPAVKKILHYIKSRTSSDDKVEYALLPQEVTDIFNRAFLTDISKTIANKEVFAAELTNTIAEIKKAIVRRKLTAIATKLKGRDENEMGGFNDEFKRLSAELKQLSRKSYEK